MTDKQLPPLPPIHIEDSIPYGAIRYVAGYPESYVQQYARDYAAAVWTASRKLALEEAAQICDQVERQQEIDNGAANTGGAAECASAIRSIRAGDEGKEQEGQKG